MLALLGGEPVRPDPYPTWPVFDDTEVDAVADVVRTGEWGRLGSHRVIAFERAFAAFQGAAYGLAVNSGTSALEMGLEALRLPRGSEVILAPFTFMASATSILNAGLVPVFVDIDPETYNLDPACIAAAITPRTSAIMAVHFGGLACDMQAILDIAAARGLRVIEDAAHSHGGAWCDRGLGTIGDVGCFSFQASKNLNAGEGGAVLTNDIDIFSRAIAQHDLWGGGVVQRGGQLGRGSLATGEGWDFTVSAGDRRITPFQAALLQAQLGRLEDQARRRAANGGYLNDLLDDLEGIAVRRIDAFATRPAHHVYVFRYHADGFKGLSRERFIEAMNAEGIPVIQGYRQPLHRTALFADVDGALARAWPRGDGAPDIDYAEVSCPHAERLCADETLFLTQNVLLDDEAGMVQIADAIEKVREHAEALIAADGAATPRSDPPSA